MPKEQKVEQAGQADECPQCAFYPSYTGGHCFKCGLYRPSGPRAKDVRANSKDMVDYFKTNVGHRLMKYWDEDHNKDLMDYL